MWAELSSCGCWKACGQGRVFISDHIISLPGAGGCFSGLWEHAKEEFKVSPHLLSFLFLAAGATPSIVCPP